MTRPAEAPGDAPLRIAVIMRALPEGSGMGGVSYQAHFLAQRLAARGHRLTVFSADPAPGGALYEVRQLAASLPAAARRKLAFAYLGFPRLIAGCDFSAFDVVHAHGDNHFLRRAGAPVVRTYWGSDLGEALADLRLKPLLARLLGYGCEWLAATASDRTVAISENTRRHLPFLRQVIFPGVDLDELAPDPASVTARSPAPSVLFVAGTLGGRKRGRLLVDAFHRHVRPALPAAELWLVCPERVEGPGVRWFGKLSPAPEERRQLIELFRSAWIFCLPSSYEGLGIPYVEALAAGAAVVATPNPGAREVLEDGRHGLLVAPGDLGPALARVIADERLRSDYAVKGRERARAFSWEVVVPAYERLFRAAIAGRRSG